MQTMLQCLDNVVQYLKKVPKTLIGRCMGHLSSKIFIERFLINSESVRVLVGSFIIGEGASGVLL